ncbi:hypothetical protein CK203_039780 [Vitis vinifera]|uniref:Reverse transcriptase zinc-binding domain-containing protein n=1 Tax=Vitis vinifera TaxID=29760 RepID=A0A438HTQ1_VITVI|nr:hypothetical protein CK203_039780 [Vitis vinifera]
MVHKEVRERFGAGLWKAIRNSWGVFKVKTRLQVGARTRVKFWEDRWCGETLLRDVFLGPNSTASSKDAWVVDVWDGGSWDPRFIRQFNDWEMEDVNRFFRRLHNYIASGTIDDMVWLGTKNGAPIRASFFAWEATWAKILTQDQLRRRDGGCQIDATCWLMHSSVRGVLLSWNSCSVGKKGKRLGKLPHFALFGLFGRKGIREPLRIGKAQIKQSKLAGFKMEVVKVFSAGHARRLASSVDFSTCPDGTTNWFIM